jgi:hypothetical protein
MMFPAFKANRPLRLGLFHWNSRAKGCGIARNRQYFSLRTYLLSPQGLVATWAKLNGHDRSRFRPQVSAGTEVVPDRDRFRIRPRLRLIESSVANCKKEHADGSFPNMASTQLAPCCTRSYPDPTAIRSPSPGVIMDESESGSHVGCAAAEDFLAAYEVFRDARAAARMTRLGEEVSF